MQYNSIILAVMPYTAGKETAGLAESDDSLPPGFVINITYALTWHQLCAYYLYVVIRLHKK